MLEKTLHFLMNGIVPGESWRISAYEAHCMQVALERLSPYFNDNDTDFLIWHMTLGVEAQKFALREFRDITSHTEILPINIDRVFFEILLKAERARLAEYEPATPCDGCGRTVYDHENTLREWLEREIEFPKYFTISRKKLEQVPWEKRQQDLRCLARKDAEKIIEQEMKQWEVRFVMEDIPDKEETMANTERQLWTILERYLLD